MAIIDAAEGPRPPQPPPSLPPATGAPLGGGSTADVGDEGVRAEGGGGTYNYLELADDFGR